MVDKTPKDQPTAFDSIPHSLISDKERKKMAEEWAKKTLDIISNIAISNKDIAYALCETAVFHAINNNELTIFIQDRLKRRCGRPNKVLPNKMLLIHYAHEMLESDGNHVEVMKQLNDLVRRMEGSLLSPESIENRITKAIGDVRNDKQSLSDLPDWAQQVIQSRMDKGTKTGRRIK